MRAQDDLGRLADLDFAGLALVDKGEHPDRFRIDQREHRLSRAERGAKLLQARGHHGVVGRRQRVKIERRGFLLLLRLGVADGGPRHRNIARGQIHVRKRGVLRRLRRLGRLDRGGVALHQLLPALVDGLGIGEIRLRLLRARRRPLEVGFGLLGGRFGPADARRSARGRRGGPAPRPWRRGRRHRRASSTSTPETLKPILEVTRASTVPRPKTWTGTSRWTAPTCTLTGRR